MTRDQLSHVVIVGGGFGGLAAARALRLGRRTFVFGVQQRSGYLIKERPEGVIVVSID